MPTPDHNARKVAVPVRSLAILTALLALAIAIVALVVAVTAAAEPAFAEPRPGAGLAKTAPMGRPTAWTPSPSRPSARGRA